MISRFTAVAKIGPLRVGGFVGWLLWLVVHITFLTGFKNRFGALTRWAVSFVGADATSGRSRDAGWPGRGAPPKLPRVPAGTRAERGGSPHAHQRDTDRRAERRHQRHPSAHRPHRQREDPAQRGAALARTGRRRQRGRAGRGQGAARRDPGEGEGRGAVGTPPPARVRRHGHRLHGARLHERDPRLRRRRGVAVRRGGAELGQPDHPGQVRDRGAEAEVAPPAHRGDHAVGLLHDRARERRLRPALHSDHRHPRGRRVGDQRAQVVHLQRARRRLLHRDVPGQGVQGRRGAGPDGADHRADLQPRRHHRARHRHLGQRQVGPLRGALRQRPGPATRTCWARSATGTGRRRTASAPAASSTA